MKYADIEDYLTVWLGQFYGGDDQPAMPLFSFDPYNAITSKATPNAMIYLAVGSGAGLSKEQVFDRPFITVRTIGLQGDFDSAEQLAEHVDAGFLLLGSNGIVGSTTVLYVTRSGGKPTLLLKDTADRYHFTCSYITETPTGL